MAKTLIGNSWQDTKWYLLLLFLITICGFSKHHCQASLLQQTNDSLDVLECTGLPGPSLLSLSSSSAAQSSDWSVLQQPAQPSDAETRLPGLPQEGSPLSDSKLYTIKGPQVILPFPGQKENQRLLARSLLQIIKQADFWPHCEFVKKKTDQKEKKWKISSAGQTRRLISILLYRHMKSGHAGKKCNFLHNVFPFHSIYTTGSRPPHFLSILADEILRMVSLGRRNIKLLRSAKKWKSHLASVFYHHKWVIMAQVTCPFFHLWKLLISQTSPTPRIIGGACWQRIFLCSSQTQSEFPGGGLGTVPLASIQVISMLRLKNTGLGTMFILKNKMPFLIFLFEFFRRQNMD